MLVFQIGLRCGGDRGASSMGHCVLSFVPSNGVEHQGTRSGIAVRQLLPSFRVSSYVGKDGIVICFCDEFKEAIAKRG